MKIKRGFSLIGAIVGLEIYIENEKLFKLGVLEEKEVTHTKAKFKLYFDTWFKKSDEYLVDSEVIEEIKVNVNPTISISLLCWLVFFAFMEIYQPVSKLFSDLMFVGVTAIYFLLYFFYLKKHYFKVDFYDKNHSKIHCDKVEK